MNNKNKSDNGKVDTSRRDLLKGITTAAVVGSVVAGTSTAVSAKEEIAVKPEKATDGYHETQHIRDYYESL
ncbi:twin-arginine translocation signal domain-containing protein [Vibrio sp. ZSDE26]|uniref:Twin-arginine translocation signal domain-containing protein n=1 Tax=Vibrio amylolyticus TaxID=2847292 RepID=A0A9X1XPY6_9VIBR|nr:twin-arginine translocation signal domain-containing protein [Vibrio amylolyticus]MCK6264985.1 twin-arginine translocation signal domain-containing protein [Vibrio amylolyticus]